MSAAPPSNRPSDSSFYNQRLKAWHPILTPKWVIVSFTIVGIVFIPIGIALLVASNSVVEYVKQYDGEGATEAACKIGAGENRTCTITFDVTEEMKAPVYVYYELDNFYQNHRRYVKSRSDAQLKGELLSEGDLTDCDPLVTAADGKVLHPCGLIANSFFNDSFKAGGVYSIDETDISWATDRENKFKALSPEVEAQNADKFQFLNTTYPGVGDVTNEHFIVWMRTAALPRFRKLYGRIGKDIPAGSTISFDVQANFVVSTFEGKKSLVISTLSWMGGKNPFLGIAYIVVGAICIFLSIIFAIKEFVCPRPLGDVRYLRWNLR